MDIWNLNSKSGTAPNENDSFRKLPRFINRHNWNEHRQ